MSFMMPSQMLRTAIELVAHDKTATMMWWARVGDRLRFTPRPAPRSNYRVLGGTPYARCRVNRSSLT